MDPTRDVWDGSSLDDPTNDPQDDADDEWRFDPTAIKKWVDCDGMDGYARAYCAVS